MFCNELARSYYQIMSSLRCDGDLELVIPQRIQSKKDSAAFIKREGLRNKGGVLFISSAPCSSSKGINEMSDFK